jgi:hypothetical protein
LPPRQIRRPQHLKTKRLRTKKPRTKRLKTKRLRTKRLRTKRLRTKTKGPLSGKVKVKREINLKIRAFTKHLNYLSYVITRALEMVYGSAGILNAALRSQALTSEGSERDFGVGGVTKVRAGALSGMLRDAELSLYHHLSR